MQDLFWKVLNIISRSYWTITKQIASLLDISAVQNLHNLSLLNSSYMDYWQLMEKVISFRQRGLNLQNKSNQGYLVYFLLSHYSAFIFILFHQKVKINSHENSSFLSLWQALSSKLLHICVIQLLHGWFQLSKSFLEIQYHLWNLIS